MITVGLIEFELMPFWCWFYKSGLNYNGEDIFDSIQLGFLEIRKYKSKRTLHLWKK